MSQISKPRVVIFGASAHATVVLDVLLRQGRYEPVGFLDDVDPGRYGTQHFGLPVIGGSEQLANVRQSGVEYAIVGFGHSRRRLETAEALTREGFKLATAIHPLANVGLGSSIGEGSVVKPGSLIDVDVALGRNVIVGSGVIISHGARVAEGVRIAAGAVIGANVVLERGAFIGLAVSVKNGARIGAFALVGAGALVLDDVAEETVAFGFPAEHVRRVSDQDL